MTVIIDSQDSDESTEPPGFVCASCTNTIEGEPSTELRIGLVCMDCHGTCMYCETNFNRNSGSEHASNDNGEACGRCTRQNYAFCNHCDEWLLREETSYLSGGYWCESCRENYFTFCEDCDEYIADDDYNHNDECCANSAIHDYSYRPKPIFNHTQVEMDEAKIIDQESSGVIRKFRKIPYMGFELEVECRSDRNDYRNGVSLFADTPLVYLKGDGSLNYGFEIVTHPMTLDYAMENFPWDLIKNLESACFDAWGTDTAGLHVHVSRDGFASESHQARFVHFFHRNEEFLSWLSGRKGSRWASFEKEHLHNLRDKLRRTRGSERYMAVNLNNSGTLEVRIFRASLKPERVQMALQLVDAIVNYTEKLSANQMVMGDAFLANSFIQWVSGKTRYAILSDYLNRWVEPFESGLPRIGE